MLDEKGFKRKRFADIFSELEVKAREAFGEKINTSERSPLGIILRLFAWALSLLWQQLENVYNSAYVDTATGNPLGHVGKYIGINKRGKEKAKGAITITGEPGIPITKGERVKTAKGIVFETLTDAVIGADRYIDIPIAAVEAGASGNVAAGEINAFVKPQFFQITVTNNGKTDGGREQETDLEFRQRYNRSISKGGSSTTESIAATLLELPGVRDCTVQENDSNVEVNGIPEKSLAPVVFGGDDQEIAYAIFRSKAGGIKSWGVKNITVKDSGGNNHLIGFSRPTVVSIFANIALTTNSHFPADGLKQVKTISIQHIGGEDEDGSVYNGLGLEESVIHSRWISAVYQVPGIVDVDLKIGVVPESLGTANIPIGSREVAQTDWQKVVVS